MARNRTKPDPPQTEEGEIPIPPVPTGIASLLRLASIDSGFCRELIERRGHVGEPAGIELTASEKTILAAIPSRQLEEMAQRLPPPSRARRDFLRRTAASAVILLGGGVLLEGLSSCQSPAAPEPTAPLPRPEHREMENAGGADPSLPPNRFDEEDEEEHDEEGGDGVDEESDDEGEGDLEDLAE